jgi:ribosomal-protein-alanine N-acetyltransferase
MSPYGLHNIRIREASLTDLRGIILLANTCIMELAGTKGGKIARAVSERITIDLKLYPTTSLVACDGEELVGFSLTEIVGSFASILLLAVSPKHRRTGVGSALVNATISRLKEGGVKYVELMTPSENEQAQSFWISEGFEDAKMKVFSRFLGRYDTGGPS